MRVALITGASSGMGRQFALRAAGEAPADEVWVVARRKERLEELSAVISVPVRIFPLDLQRRADLDKLRDTLKAYKPKITLLVNAAGYCKFGNTSDLTEQEAAGMVALNVGALISVTQMVLPYLVPGARVLQVASTAAFQPLPGMNIYAASKAFVLSYSRALNRELRGRRVTVIAVCPGWTKTEFFDVAKDTRNPGTVRKFPLMTRASDVVKQAYRDSRMGKDVSVYGLHNQLQRAAAKFLPHQLVMAVWERVKD